jgi:Fe-S-cluster containining protein
LNQDSLTKRIFEECDRLGEEDRFTFSCHPGVSCFNNCCGDVNIVLTPYDILRLKNRLGISSEEFHDRFALMPFTKDQRLPAVVLKMTEEEGKPCPFLTEEGCSVYEDRPWACRMYPLGLAAPGQGEDNEEGFYFLLKEDRCHGHAEGREQTVGQWLDEQGIRPYDEMGELFKELQLHPFFEKGGNLTPRQMHMFFLACFDLDAFRRFVFESTFLRRFEVDEETVERIRTDDVELMKFGVRWVRYSLLGDGDLMTVRPDAIPDDQQERAQ